MRTIWPIVGWLIYISWLRFFSADRSCSSVSEQRRLFGLSRLIRGPECMARQSRPAQLNQRGSGGSLCKSSIIEQVSRCKRFKTVFMLWIHNYEESQLVLLKCDLGRPSANA